jgi:hypothetical protein
MGSIDGRNTTAPPFAPSLTCAAGVDRFPGAVGPPEAVTVEPREQRPMVRLFGAHCRAVPAVVDHRHATFREPRPV